LPLAALSSRMLRVVKAAAAMGSEAAARGNLAACKAFEPGSAEPWPSRRPP
jgi:hypothetical protein